MSNFDLIIVIIALIIIIVLAICLVHYVNNHQNKRNDEDGSNQVPVIPDVPYLQVRNSLQELDAQNSNSKFTFDTIDLQHNIDFSNDKLDVPSFTVQESGIYKISFSADVSYPGDEITDLEKLWSALFTFYEGEGTIPQGQIDINGIGTATIRASTSFMLSLAENQYVGFNLQSFRTPNNKLFILNSTLNVHRIATN